MAEIIPFGPQPATPEVADEAPHLQGGAICTHCQHEWQAVAPAGTTCLTCPACGTDRGVMKGLCYPPEEACFWVCTCGSHLFLLLPTGAPLCVGCGLRATGWAES